jgi:membrane protein EpsK
MIATAQGDDGQATRLFNSAIIWNLLLFLVLLPPACWFAFHPQWLFRIPPGYAGQAGVLFVCVVLTFLLNTLLSTYTVATFCRNRLDIRNGIAILGTLLRTGVIVVLFRVTVPQLWYVGLAALLSTLAMLVLSIWAWRYLLPSISFAPRSARWADIREIAFSGGWYLVDQIGTLLLFSTSLLVVNRVFGPEASGLFGTVQLWPSLLGSFATVLGAVFTPNITTLYARQDIEGLRLYLYRVLRFVGLSIALPIGIVCGFAAPLLVVWGGPRFQHAAPLLLLLTLPHCINIWVFPLFDVTIAVNKLRVPALVTCALGVVNIGLALLLALPVNWGLYGVAAAGAVISIVKFFVFTPLYTARLLKWRWSSFYRGAGAIIGAGFGVTGCCWLCSALAPPRNWSSLIVMGTLVSVLYFGVAYYLLLTHEERAFASQLLPLLRRLPGQQQEPVE